MVEALECIIHRRLLHSKPVGYGGVMRVTVGEWRVGCNLFASKGGISLFMDPRSMEGRNKSGHQFGEYYKGRGCSRGRAFT